MRFGLGIPSPLFWGCAWRSLLSLCTACNERCLFQPRLSSWCTCKLLSGKDGLLPRQLSACMISKPYKGGQIQKHSQNGNGRISEHASSGYLHGRHNRRCSQMHIQKQAGNAGKEESVWTAHFSLHVTGTSRGAAECTVSGRRTGSGGCRGQLDIHSLPVCGGLLQSAVGGCEGHLQLDARHSAACCIPADCYGAKRGRESHARGGFCRGAFLSCHVQHV